MSDQPLSPFAAITEAFKLLNDITAAQSAVYAKIYEQLATLDGSAESNAAAFAALRAVPVPKNKPAKRSVKRDPSKPKCVPLDRFLHRFHAYSLSL